MPVHVAGGVPAVADVPVAELALRQCRGDSVEIRPYPATTLLLAQCLCERQ